jgi:hypothetical protein
MPTLQEMVDLVPELYETLRERDSLANHVCEVLSRNGQVREILHKWQGRSKRIKVLVGRALELHAEQQTKQAENNSEAKGT